MISFILELQGSCLKQHKISKKLIFFIENVKEKKVLIMTKLNCNDFEAMSIVELVEFIEKMRFEIVEYKAELLKFFKKRRVESLVPYYFFDLFSDVKNEYDLRSEYYDNIQSEDKAEVLNLPKDFFDTHGITERDIKYSIFKVNDILFEFFLFEGNILFLEDLLDKGYFESGKAQVLLKRYIQKIHWSRFKYNDDIMSAFAVFMKGKEESIQMMLTELIVEYVERSERAERILLYIYRNGLNYTKRGVIHVFVTNGSRMFSGTDDFYGAKEVLDVVADDMEGEDRYLRNQIISFIELFELVQDEISQYLLKEKGIVYTEDMKYEAFYDKVVNMAEILKAKIDEEKQKENNTKP